jgi:hypothetical protein
MTYAFREWSGVWLYAPLQIDSADPEMDNSVSRREEGDPTHECCSDQGDRWSRDVASILEVPFDDARYGWGEIQNMNLLPPGNINWRSLKIYKRASSIRGCQAEVSEDPRES